MRRLVDVLFVEPKNKRMVVLHQGKFWQLPSMGISKSSWILKLLYKGSLNDIVLCKNQHIDCPFVSQILKPKSLPAQLHGISANRFLGWWETNGHQWVSDDSVAQPTNTQTTQRPQTVVNPAALKIIQKNQTNTAQTPNAAANTTKAPQSMQQTTQQAVQTATKEVTTSVSPNTNPSDVFDALLLELTHDVLQQSH